MTDKLDRIAHRAWREWQLDYAARALAAEALGGTAINFGRDTPQTSVRTVPGDFSVNSNKDGAQR